MEIQVRFTLSIGLNNAQQEDDYYIEVPDDFYSLPEETQQTLLHDEWKEWIWNYVDGGCSPITEEDGE